MFLYVCLWFQVKIYPAGDERNAQLINVTADNTAYNVTVILLTSYLNSLSYRNSAGWYEECRTSSLLKLVHCRYKYNAKGLFYSRTPFSTKKLKTHNENKAFR